jgi:arginine-tRNA-protein transferase
MNISPPKRLQFFVGTLTQPCPYLPGRLESKVVTELAGEHAVTLHDELTRVGFRRSHSLAYKPACRACDACVPVRIRVAEFEPGQSLKRVWRRNADLTASERSPCATREQFDLFTRYQRSRHATGGMALMDFADYKSMVEDTPTDTFVVEFRNGEGRLVAVTLSDRLSDGLSGVYKIFDPEDRRRSAGTFVVLWHIERARGMSLPYVYLGYWIADCRKMSYKMRFQPLEAFGADGWRLIRRPIVRVERDSIRTPRPS